MPSFKEFYFTSSTGRNQIRVKQCTPDAEPKAIVQIAHGIAEHVDRYTEFMEHLAANGYLAVANDHLGHGKSLRPGEPLGFFADEDGWDYVVADMVKLHDRISGEYPGLPHIMFGHSMGSFLTRTYIIKHPDKYDAAILSGTGQQAKALVLGGYAAAAASVKLYGPRKIGDKLNDLAFGAYTKGIENPRTSFDWLTRVDSEVDKYIADPLCGFVTTVSLFRDMMGGVKFITNQKNINTMSKAQPIYFMSGDRDPVGDYGKGVDRAYKAFCKAGLHDVMMRLYPGGRHEMLNEENKYQVYKDITAWLDDKLSGMKK